jgi:hypothetical protein
MLIFFDTGGIVHKEFAPPGQTAISVAPEGKSLAQTSKQMGQ